MRRVFVCCWHPATVAAARIQFQDGGLLRRWMQLQVLHGGVHVSRILLFGAESVRRTPWLPLPRAAGVELSTCASVMLRWTWRRPYCMSTLRRSCWCSSRFCMTSEFVYFVLTWCASDVAPPFASAAGVELGCCAREMVGWTLYRPLARWTGLPDIFAKSFPPTLGSTWTDFMAVCSVFLAAADMDADDPGQAEPGPSSL